MDRTTMKIEMCTRNFHSSKNREETTEVSQFISQEIQKKLEKSRTQKNWTVLLGLLGLVVLFYAITIHRMF